MVSLQHWLYNETPSGLATLRFHLPHSSAQTVILATGLQSSGSTLLSWCFLQRSDMNGVLDGDTDLIPQLPATIGARYAWYKTTVSSFTLRDQIACLQDDGFNVLPLLMVRDVRVVWASLARKHYGRNGITAEDPPLRLRLRRFLESWQYAVDNQLPVIKYEEFVQQPEAVLRKCCKALSLPWDEDMLNWPKPATEIADMRHGNATFRDSDKRGLLAAIKQPEGVESGTIHEQDLDWLDEYFAEFNQALGYPSQLSSFTKLPGRLVPDWRQSRRCKWRLRQKPFRYWLSKLKIISYTPRPE